jgi:hypothetical protein
MKQLYLVGYVPDIINKELEWEFVGIFDSIAKARKAAKHVNCFIGKIKLNENLGIERTPWPEGDYEWPHFEKVLK